MNIKRKLSRGKDQAPAELAVVPDPAPTLADLRSQIVNLANQGKASDVIADLTGQDVVTVRRVIHAWAQEQAIKPPARRMRRVKAAKAVKVPPTSEERAKRWLRAAGGAVGLLAAGAAVVSYQAQLQLVERTKHTHAAYIQAAIPDMGALVFALMGVSLALQGKRAVRARALNALCVGLSVGMNYLAARPGWHDTSIWVMAPTVYAFASDSLIWIIRLTTLNGKKGRTEEEGSTLLGMVAAIFLWLLRLVFAPVSTVTGFAEWVRSTPAAPGGFIPAPKEEKRRSVKPDRRGEKPQGQKPPARRGRRGVKLPAFLALVQDTYGPLAGIDLARVSPICKELCQGDSPRSDLNAGSARKALRAAILSAQNGNSR